MKFFVVVITIALSAAFGDADDSYDYTLRAERVSNFAYPGNPVIRMETATQPVMSITFTERINSDNPLTADAEVNTGDREIYYANSTNGRLNLCQKYDEGTWEYAITNIVNSNLISEDGCSVDVGTQRVTIEADFVDLDLSEQLPCGPYNLNCYLFSKDKLVMIVDYTFSIGENCS